MKRQELIKGLREIADHLESSEFDDSYNSRYFGSTFYIGCDTKESFLKNAKALGGFQKETYASSDLQIRKDFCNNLFELKVFVPKNVTCKKIMVKKEFQQKIKNKILKI